MQFIFSNFYIFSFFGYYASGCSIRYNAGNLSMLPAMLPAMFRAVLLTVLATLFSSFSR